MHYSSAISLLMYKTKRLLRIIMAVLSQNSINLKHKMQNWLTGTSFQ